MDLSLLATLKDKLVHAKDFSEVLGYFFDHFGDHPEFIALGERAEDPFLEDVVSQVGRQMFPGKVVVNDFLLSRLPEHRFLHGGLTINGQLGNIIYFEDIHMGLISVVSIFGRGETKMARFTGRPMPDNYQRSKN